MLPACVAATAAMALAIAACGRLGNPVLGDWELDRDETSVTAALAAELTDLATMTFRDDAIVAGDSVIPVTWVVEEKRVRAIRADGRGEHAIELLPDGRIRVSLPVGVEAVYARAGS
ncbi:MAG: hypothetical protein MUF70_17410 [Myxococcota bacterium]|nr:hypothetical protein [Myxococcota bacterium]